MTGPILKAKANLFFSEVDPRKEGKAFSANLKPIAEMGLLETQIYNTDKSGLFFRFL